MHSPAPLMIIYIKLRISSFVFMQPDCKSHLNLLASEWRLMFTTINNRAWSTRLGHHRLARWSTSRVFFFAVVRTCTWACASSKGQAVQLIDSPAPDRVSGVCSCDGSDDPLSPRGPRLSLYPVSASSLPPLLRRVAPPPTNKPWLIEVCYGARNKPPTCDLWLWLTLSSSASGDLNHDKMRRYVSIYIFA